MSICSKERNIYIHTHIKLQNVGHTMHGKRENLILHLDCTIQDFLGFVLKHKQHYN